MELRTCRSGSARHVGRSPTYGKSHIVTNYGRKRAVIW